MNNKKAFFVLGLIAVSLLLVFVNACKKDPAETTPVDTTNHTITCQLNIPGGCLDQWVTVGADGSTWIEPGGDFLRTLNELSSMPPEIGGPGPVTVVETTDSYSGKAAKLTTKIFHPLPTTNIVLPGMLGATRLDIPNQTIHIGKPYTFKPVKFQGYYKYQPVNGDSALVLILLSKYNSGTGKRDTIGYVRQTYTAAITTYTKIELPIYYYPAHISETPDSLSLIIISSAGLNLQSLTQCTGQDGSTLWMDEISFIMP
ncbi:MAG: PCMD domain-containing protein [Bacteroidia bacterium]|nr:PCMD domain-containing protein [Bacteroidia bacterium]